MVIFHNYVSLPEGNDLWLVRGIIPRDPYFRLVNPYNFPRTMDTWDLINQGYGHLLVITGYKML